MAEYASYDEEKAALLIDRKQTVVDSMKDFASVTASQSGPRGIELAFTASGDLPEANIMAEAQQVKRNLDRIFDITAFGAEWIEKKNGALQGRTYTTYLVTKEQKDFPAIQARLEEVLEEYRQRQSTDRAFAASAPAPTPDAGAEVSAPTSSVLEPQATETVGKAPSSDADASFAPSLVQSSPVNPDPFNGQVADNSGIPEVPEAAPEIVSKIQPTAPAAGAAEINDLGLPAYLRPDSLQQVAPSGKSDGVEQKMPATPPLSSEEAWNSEPPAPAPQSTIHYDRDEVVSRMVDLVKEAKLLEISPAFYGDGFLSINTRADATSPYFHLNNETAKLGLGFILEDAGFTVLAGKKEDNAKLNASDPIYHHGLVTLSLPPEEVKPARQIIELLNEAMKKIHAERKLERENKWAENPVNEKDPERGPQPSVKKPVPIPEPSRKEAEDTTGQKPPPAQLPKRPIHAVEAVNARQPVAEGQNQGGFYLSDYGFDHSGIVFGKPVKKPNGLHLHDHELALAQQHFGEHFDAASRITHFAVSQKHKRATYKLHTGEVIQIPTRQQPDGSHKMSALLFKDNHVHKDSGDAILNLLEAQGHSIDAGQVNVRGSKEFVQKANAAIDRERVRRKDMAMDMVTDLRRETTDVVDLQLLGAMQQKLKNGQVPTSIVTQMVREGAAGGNTIGNGAAAPDIKHMAELMGITPATVAENTVTGPSQKKQAPQPKQSSFAA